MKLFIFLALLCSPAVATVWPLGDEPLDLSSSAGLRIVIVTQPEWCPPCRTYEPTVYRAARELKDVTFFYSQDLNWWWATGTVTVIPTTIFHSNVRACRGSLTGDISRESLELWIRRVQRCEKTGGWR